MRGFAPSNLATAASEDYRATLPNQRLQLVAVVVAAAAAVGQANE